MLEQAPVNKKQNREQIKDEEVVMHSYFYPDYQITITAPTQAEADAQLAKVLKGKN